LLCEAQSVKSALRVLGAESLRRTRALPKHSQAKIENRDQRHSHQETCQNKLLSMLQHFSEHGMRSQIEKSAAYVRHD
jgi:hypothetical protein